LKTEAGFTNPSNSETPSQKKKKKKKEKRKRNRKGRRKIGKTVQFLCQRCAATIS
jgi:hypothetical protein